MLALTSPTIGGRSVGIVRSRTRATEFSFSLAEGKWPLVRPKKSWKENIRMDRKEYDRTVSAFSWLNIWTSLHYNELSDSLQGRKCLYKAAIGFGC
jgi:hypothetical protein